jgi:hypothetical protein
MKRLWIAACLVLPLTALMAVDLPSGDSWPQWAKNPQHTGFIQVSGQSASHKLAEIRYDPFVLCSGRDSILRDAFDCPVVWQRTTLESKWHHTNLGTTIQNRPVCSFVVSRRLFPLDPHRSSQPGDCHNPRSLHSTGHRFAMICSGRDAELRRPEHPQSSQKHGLNGPPPFVNHPVQFCMNRPVLSPRRQCS